MEARTASGRLRRFSGEPADFPHTQYLNTPIQGTGAVGLKLALALLHPRLRDLGGSIVNIIHDEVVADVPPDRADEARALVESCMVEGMSEVVHNVPIVVEADIRATWAKGT